ncbi:MAG: M48 family metallopeptidase [Rickettsia endosymbiont of Labidopullus appendiculatus]|nr:M48 family metallopeptidase [Rickettsia endosymbiont of Labidopullus appendiculatus]MCC8484228.1 M48 family metallopeptidase [Rickettsia endosymbiont of Labidopullus appendiculatus]
MNNQPQLIPNFITLDKLGYGIDIPIRCSNKAKRIAIKINHKGAELVLPNKNFHAGYKFLLDKESWIRRNLPDYSKQDPIDNNTITVFDKMYSLLHIDADYNKVQIGEDIIQIYSLPSQHKSTLTRFLQDKLLLEAVNLVTFLGKKHNINFSKIKITNNKNKWGSCSSNAVLAFNWRLIFAPKKILKYLVVHEICHIMEMNHSKHFWHLVARLYPDYKLARLWLKENGNKLHQYLQ